MFEQWMNIGKLAFNGSYHLKWGWIIFVCILAGKAAQINSWSFMLPYSTN